MGLETSTYINGLVSSNPLGTDVMSKGDDHIRLLKATITASFPDVDEAVTTIHNGSTAPASKQASTLWRDTGNNVIKMWDGSAWFILAIDFNTSNKVDINSGTIDGTTINGGTIGVTTPVTELRVDNVKVDGNDITSLNSNGNINLTPNGTGSVVIDGQSFPQADGANTNYLTTNGSGQIAWTANTVPASEANALASANASATSATQSANSATASQTSASASQTAQTACETALDNFDDRFLGAKSALPSLDNDNNALADGTLFFNTSQNYMMVWDLGTTAWFQLTNTVSDQNNINTCATSISNINTVGGNINSVNDFSQRYRVQNSPPTTSLTVGDLYFDTVQNTLNAYGTSWQLTAPSSASQTNINIVAGNILATEDLGSIADAVDTSSGNNISAVAGAITNINAVAGLSATLTSVNSNSTNINAVNANSANINIVAGQNANVTSLAGISSSITGVNTISASVTGVNTISSAVSAVNSNASNINAVNANSTNINSVQSNATNINSVAGSISNIGTVAGGLADINRYAVEYTISGSQPGSPSAGHLWMDTSASVLKYYSGSSFASLTAGIAEIVQDTTPQLGGALDCQNNNISNCGTLEGSNLQMDFGGI